MSTSNVNPYAPPQAAVADVDAAATEVGELRLWSSRGRVGRLRFLAWLTGANLLVGLFNSVQVAALTDLHMPLLSTVLVWTATAAFFIFGVLTAMQRSHDMDWSGWSVFAMLIPFVAFVWVFKGGTRGSNRFGAPPPPNSTGVKLLGVLFPVVVVIGIVAAIALPAYQDYAKRARAAQVR